MAAVLVLRVVLASGSTTLYVSPDIAINPDGPQTHFPHHVVEVARDRETPFRLELSLPTGGAVDAVHKLDGIGQWLVSLDVPTELARPRDVIRVVDGIETLFFDGGCVAGSLPVYADIAAVTLFPDDGGNLFISLRDPAEVAGATVLPGTVLEYARTSSGPCGWAFQGIAFDLAKDSAAYAPRGVAVTGLDLHDGLVLVTFDAPVDLAPSDGPTLYLPYVVAAFDPGTGMWTPFESLGPVGTSGWPVESRIDALSCEAHPGRIDPLAGVDAQVLLGKAGDEVVIRCPGSCASGARQYGIYQGSLTQVRIGIYDHTPVSCVSSCPGDLILTLSPDDAYFLVTPHNGFEEGSFGLAAIDGRTHERPPGVEADGRCASVRNLTPCPSPAAVLE